MELKDRVVVILMKRIWQDYHAFMEKMNIDELGQIVNKHLSVCLDEIKEDIAMANRNTALQRV